MSTPALHILIYADSGAGKSTFLATLPKPMLVLSWDPIGKESPYLRTGKVQLQDDGTQHVYSRKHADRLLIQVEHYIDDGTGTSYPRYLSRMARFDKGNEVAQWATVICDSVTFMEIAARKHQQYKLNPNTKEPRQWYASGTEALEEQLMLRFGSLPCNVGVACHVDDSRSDIHGNQIRVPNAPGRLRKNLPAGFSECYRLDKTRDDKGTTVYRMQTQSDDEWVAGSQIQGLPEWVYPHYRELKAVLDTADQS